MKLTRIDLNSWLLEMAGKTILVDPWLVDPLTFYGLPWLFQAEHKIPPVFTPQTLPPVDLILLSQGVDDHCHKPTLQQLDREIPVVACPTAARTVQQLGYIDVHPLSHWQEHTVDNLTLVAIPGPEIQGQPENGYLLLDRAGEALYYEPHLSCLADRQRIAARTAVDLLLIPVVGQVFPLLGQVIMGPDQALEVVEMLRPHTVVPTALGDLKAQGILQQLTRVMGSIEEFAHKLKSAGLPAQLRCPAPGETVEVSRSLGQSQWTL